MITTKCTQHILFPTVPEINLENSICQHVCLVSGRWKSSYLASCEAVGVGGTGIFAGVGDIYNKATLKLLLQTQQCFISFQ